MTLDSTSKRPPKPRPDFPLYAHKVGRWAKKVRQKVVYFTQWSEDPKGKAALEMWLAQKDDLLAGREPRAKTEALTVAGLVNAFLTSKDALVKNHELHPATWQEYHRTCSDIVAVLGQNRAADDLEPSDFEKLRAHFAQKVGPTRLGKLIQITRSVFRFGQESRLVKTAIYFGPGFKRPSKKVLRKHRAERGPKLFSREEVLALLNTADVTMKAVVLLGLNAALGNSDIGRLEEKHLGLARGWLTFPRPKSGIDRRAKLWPETVQAIREALAVRPLSEDPAHRHRVFISKQGKPWCDEADKRRAVSHAFTALCKTAGVDARGRGFCCLRHTARTVMDAAKDTPACRLVMGHADASIDDVYRETIDDSRLEAVADYLHGWLFGPTAEQRKDDAPSNRGVL